MESETPHADEPEVESEPTADPVVEPDALLSQRCKLFYRRDGAYVEKGLATLYIKQLAESNKAQLLVRYLGVI